MLLIQLFLSLMLWISACSGIVEPPVPPPSPPPPPAPAPPPAPPPPPNHVPIITEVIDIPPVQMNRTFDFAVGATDPDGDVLTFFVVTPPARGTLTLNADGTFHYVPQHDDYTSFGTGFLSFDWRVTDGRDTSDVQHYILTVNIPPTIQNDEFTITRNSTAHIGAPGVLANDFDLNGSLPRPELAYTPVHGTVPGNAIQFDGSFSYTPENGFVGVDSIGYYLDEAVGTYSVTTDIAWIFIHVIE